MVRIAPVQKQEDAISTTDEVQEIYIDMFARPHAYCTLRHHRKVNNNKPWRFVVCRTKNSNDVWRGAQ